jgi:hypothetical protein
MEYENHYASNGKGNLGVTLGAIGTGLGVLGGSNLLGGVLGGSGGCSEDHWVNRYELSMQKELTNRDMEIAYLRSRDAAKTDSLELYRYIDGKIAGIESQLCEQKVFNAGAISNISCLQSQVAQLMSLSKIVIPIDNVCPNPMPQYNSWTAPTATT